MKKKNNQKKQPKKTKTISSKMSKLMRYTIFVLFLIAIIAVFVRAEEDTEVEADVETEVEEPTTPAPPPAPVARTIRFIRDFVPDKCPITIKHNYMVTFSYTAHEVTPENRVGKKFDETPEYSTITLQANRRHMLTSLYRGLLGACIDERRTVIIPHEISDLKDESLPTNTDFVFIVNVVDVAPFTDYFDQMDINYDGCITLNEFKVYVSEQRKTAPHLIDIAAEKLMSFHDKDKDGYVECSEFSSSNKHCTNITCIPVLRRKQEEARLLREKLEREELARKIEAERLRKIEEERKAEEERVRKLEEEIRRIEAEKLAERRRIEAEEAAERRRIEAEEAIERRRIAAEEAAELRRVEAERRRAEGSHD
jgi:Ca2+-binding EF-hand superfamily protein